MTSTFDDGVASPTDGEKTMIFRDLRIMDGGMAENDQDQISTRNYWCLSLLILPIFCVFGNLAVIYVVIREKCLHTSTNLILVSLAFADILVAILVMPFSIYLITNNLVWDLPDYVCDFFCAADVSASTSSIVHLVAVSIDRFYAVVKHTEYNTSKHQHRTYWIIGLCWLFSLSIALPLGIGLNEKNAPVQQFDAASAPNFSPAPQKYCSIDNPYFMLSSSIFAFYIPCFVMLIMYGIVFNKLRRSLLAVRLREMAASHMISFGNSMGLLFQDGSRQKSKSKHNTNLTSQDQWWADPLLKTIENDIADSDVKEELSGDEIEELQNVVEILKQENLENGANVGDSPKSSDSREQDAPKKDEQSTVSITVKPKSTIERYIASPMVVVLRKPRAILKQRRLTQAKLIQNVRVRAIAVATKLKSKERGVIRKETRATKLVLIVMCAFLLCYLPFFTTNVVKIFKLWNNSWNDRWEHLFIVFTWLGYSNSCLNPIIYSIFNKKFRQTFFKTFKFCRTGNIKGTGGRRRSRSKRNGHHQLTTAAFSPKILTNFKTTYSPRIKNTTTDDGIDVKSPSSDKTSSSLRVQSEQKLLTVDQEPNCRVTDTLSHKRDLPVSVSFLEPHSAASVQGNIVVKSLPDLYNLDPNIRAEGHNSKQEQPAAVVENKTSYDL